jgi:hypothetical protein
MTLKERLDAIKAQSQTRIAPEARATIARAIDDLKKSGIVDRVVKVGDRAPDFALPDSTGRQVSLGELLARGPAVLSFFRGRW